MKIYLVRHAQSESNADLTVLHSKSNPNVNLTELGLNQAQQAGEFLSKSIKNFENTIVWNSPYRRTRLTAEIIKDSLSKNDIHYNANESIYLSERQFGILDDTKNYEDQHPNEFNHYRIHQEENTHYFARPPLGESPFDMCLRLDFFLKTILAHRTEENHIIVSHGAAIRGLIMMNSNLPYEEYLAMENPQNASVSCITHGSYQGVVFVPSAILTPSMKE